MLHKISTDNITHLQWNPETFQPGGEKNPEKDKLFHKQCAFLIFPKPLTVPLRAAALSRLLSSCDVGGDL